MYTSEEQNGFVQNYHLDFLYLIQSGKFDTHGFNTFNQTGEWIIKFFPISIIHLHYSIGKGFGYFPGNIDGQWSLMP